MSGLCRHRLWKRYSLGPSRHSETRQRLYKADFWEQRAPSLKSYLFYLLVVPAYPAWPEQWHYCVLHRIEDPSPLAKGGTTISELATNYCRPRVAPKGLLSCQPSATRVLSPQVAKQPLASLTLELYAEEGEEEAHLSSHPSLLIYRKEKATTNREGTFSFESLLSIPKHKAHRRFLREGGGVGCCLGSKRRGAVGEAAHSVVVCLADDTST